MSAKPLRQVLANPGSWFASCLMFLLEDTVSNMEGEASMPFKSLRLDFSWFIISDLKSLKDKEDINFIEFVSDMLAIYC